MGKKQPTLLPAPAGPRDDHGAQLPRFEVFPHQRVIKRQVVRAACKNCRLKKTKCDGKRPMCTRCERAAIDCHYLTNNENETPAMALKSHVESLEKKLQEHVDVLQCLQSAPAQDALDLLHRLRTSPNLPLALASVKGGMATRNRPSELLTARAILPPTHSSVEFELTMRHEIAFPGLVPVEVGSIDIDHLLRTAPRATHHQILPSISGGSRLQNDSSHLRPPVLLGPSVEPNYCHDSLKDLKMDYWTTIPISNVFAASAISLYLETDHPILCFFDADLVIRDMVEQRQDFCTPFLVSALLYTACQCYASVDISAISYSRAFFKEADKLRRADLLSTNVASLAALMQFGIACTLSGKEALVFEVFQEVRSKAAQMSLFGTQVTASQLQAFRNLSPDRLREKAHIAWGTYNWLSLHSMFFHEEPIPFPPQLPIPGEDRNSVDVQHHSSWPPHPLPAYMGETFGAMSKISIISQDILTVYRGNQDASGSTDASLAFAEAKFQELLVCADAFSKQMAQGAHSPAHVLVFYSFFHGLVLDMFRPFTRSTRPVSQSRLRTFSALDSFPHEIFNASINQLKRLLYTYVSQLQPNLYSLIFGTSVLQLNNVLLRGADHFEARFYFLLCMSYMKKMHTRYPICADIMRAHLTMALDNGIISSDDAQQLLDDIKCGGRHHDASEKAITTCIVDFDRALTVSSDARAHAMAQRFDELSILYEFTRGGDYDEEIESFALA